MNLCLQDRKENYTDKELTNYLIKLLDFDIASFQVWRCLLKADI